ncbi:hypothetical protein [Rhodoplanes sp. Z2-YC6860]|nr:hypothetical protein [Rhodoplanes sp. Z2-YC6860]
MIRAADPRSIGHRGVGPRGIGPPGAPRPLTSGIPLQAFVIVAAG